MRSLQSSTRMSALINGLFFLAALLVPLAVIVGLLSHHPGGGHHLGLAHLRSVRWPLLGRFVVDCAVCLASHPHAGLPSQPSLRS